MRPGLVATQRFSTDAHAAEDRFDAFRARIGTMFDMEALQREDSQSFSGEIVSLHLGSMLVSSMESRSFRHSRSRRRTLKDFLDHLLIRVDLDDMKRPASLRIIDLAQVTEESITPGRNLSLVVPRRMLGSDSGRLSDFHALSLNHGSAMVLADHVAALMRHGPNLDAGSIESITALTPTVIAACLNPAERHAALASGGLNLVALDKARAFINANLHNPKLDPDYVARSIGISRSVLYRLFEPRGGVASCIREARLREAARMLSREPQLRLGEISDALCFSSEAQFSRAFRTLFDCSPSEARHAWASGGRDRSTLLTASSDRPVFDRWLAVL
ncbi:helix-turn-helix transcriptional regulator [Ciceribacter sp. L1K23]|uniref:helix-turn-helix transcriptional regulator n=1 Tax=Ciceribacter sp. L1K23 TaxID=2820276 RepID=UPI001B8198D7|nr:AraC family transcriptional regulator [Ciceribacter sp. L1K23]MBR0556269.1 helix-turn-helix transcriptional regulator [Ciceribacter sp. L1K23]